MPFFVSVLGVVLAVGFYVVVERKALGGLQLRTGPHKVGPWGLLQPLADGVKLLSKQSLHPSPSHPFLFLLAPIYLLSLSLFIWVLYPVAQSAYSMPLGVLMFLCLSAISVFGTISAGWASNSKYALIGAVRGAAQTISYEVSFALLLLFCLFFREGLSLNEGQYAWGWGLVGLPLAVGFLAAGLAELNRAPFDLVEGESELVSGFNVEYGGPGFTLIMMAEYANMMFLSAMFAVVWGGVFSPLLVTGGCVFLSYGIVLARGALPRQRYDLLMGLAWQALLPLALVGLVVVLVL